MQEDDDDSEDPEMLNNSRQNFSVLPSYHHIDPSPPTERFQRSAVQSNELSKSGPGSTDKRTARPTATGRAGSGTTRASLDVDAFKRLIMTGEKDVTASGTPPTPPAQNLTSQSIPGDSSSNTDTSSVSRQSLFETMTEVATDTPRTSHEISVSDDEWQQAVGASSLATRNPELRLSNMRYETSLNSNMRRTVSFDDPSPPASALESRLHTIDVQTSNPNSLPQISTDLNKPLPLPPGHKQPEQSTSTQQASFNPDESSNRLRSTSPSLISQKRRPPTPPLARRHSQLRSPNPLLSRSNSARLPSRSSHGLGNPAQSTDVRTPPPPPTRRTLPGRAQSPFETSMHTGMVLPDSPSTVAGSTRSDKQHTSRPPLPPTRTHSISSIKRPYRPPPTASSVTKVPPVPPPRNRGSSQSSLDSTRIDSPRKPSATESSSSLRRASKDSQQEDSREPNEGPSQIPASVSGTNANDILADLSVLQREVDELRGMYEIRRASE